MVEVTLTKSLQSNCVGLFKYLILLFFRTFASGLPRSKEGQISAALAGVRCFSEQSPTEAEAAGEGKGGDAGGQKSAETLHAGSDSLHLMQEAVELRQG